jgi:hypothetical protein
LKEKLDCFYRNKNREEMKERDVIKNLTNQLALLLPAIDVKPLIMRFTKGIALAAISYAIRKSA